MLIGLALYLIWSYQVTVTCAHSHDDYSEFTISLCEGQCKTLECPLNTIMHVQMVRVYQGSLRKENCQEIKSRGLNDDEEDFDNGCEKALRNNFSEDTNSKCSHKPNCIICHNEEWKRRYRQCKESSVVKVTYMCISDKFLEEIVPSDTYVDLSCAHLIGHRIIIHKASLFSNENKTKSMNAAAKKNCSVVDVSSFVSKKCTSHYKCQAGPNNFRPKDCRNQNLLIYYSCVPEFILKIRRLSDANSLPIETQVLKKSGRKAQVVGGFVSTYVPTNAPKIDEDFDSLWLTIVLSIILFVTTSSVVFLIRWRSKHSLRRRELSNKIKQANFGPPPSSIEKIDIDLTDCNHVTLKSIPKLFVKEDDDITRQLRMGSSDCDFWKNTFSRYPTLSMRIEDPSCSLSAGSSGQMSSYQSDSSKGNPSTVFNYITREKSFPDQTPL